MMKKLLAITFVFTVGLSPNVNAQFFKKKKKSAQATKNGKDAKAQEGLPELNL